MTMPGQIPRLAEATLPIMHQTGRELRRLLGQRSTLNRRLGDVLHSDPGAAIAVFRALGRIRPNASGLVTDAGHAVSLVGLDPFRRLLDSLPEVEPGRVPNVMTGGPTTAYSQAAHAAVYADALADHRGMGGNREITTAALLQNPAVPALWATEPEAALRATNAVRDGVPPDVAFTAELGESLQDANRRLAKAWAFPHLARQSMGDWDGFNPRPQMVMLAQGLAQNTTAGWRSETTATLAVRLADFLDLGHDQASAWLHRQTVDAARALHHLDYPLPGFELLYLPGGNDDAGDRDDIPVMGGPRPHAALPQPGATADLHTTIADIMRRMRDEAGAARVIFAMLSSDRRRLHTRLALGGRADDGLRRLDLELSGNNLFSALGAKPQSVWLIGRNAARFRDHLPDPLRQVLDCRDAFMMSLFVRGRPLGLLYGDGAALDEPGYRRFRELCNEATTVLAGNRSTA